MRKVIFKNFQSPGDILMLSAAIRDLKLSHPDILVDVRTSAPEIWENNPYLTSLKENDKNVEIYDVSYPLIHTSNTGQYHFIHGFRKNIENKLNLFIEPTVFKGDIHISSKEKSWISQIEEKGIRNNFWIIVAGGKFDFTCVAKGQRVQTIRGYKRIEDITSQDKILTEWGFKKCDGSKFMGVKKCLNIKTRFSDIETTLNHKFKKINTNGEIKWIRADNLKNGDYILGKRGNAKSLKINIDDTDKWFSIGRLWGDGYIHKGACYWIFSEDDEYAKQRVKKWLDRKKINYSIKERHPSIKDRVKRIKIDYRISAKNLFNEDELPIFKKKGKWRQNGFPEKYFCLSYNDLKALIEGLFSADGTISNGHNGKDRGGISYTTIYKKFGKDIQRILWQVGITSTIKSFDFKSIWGKNCSGVTINIIGTKSRNNFKEIGFYEKHKNDRMNALNNSTTISTNDNFHGIPFIKNIVNNFKTKNDISNTLEKKSYRIKSDFKKANIIRDSMLNKIPTLFNIKNKTNILQNYIDNDWYFDQVIKISETENKEVYDIINSETESYVVEGIVSHNCKWWSPDYYQKVVDHFKNKITFVQVGHKDHWHPKLDGVVNLIGKTDLRQLIRLIYHSSGVICPVTFAMHAAAAIPMKKNTPKNRPCVVIAGGREPSQWEKYPHHRFLETNGAIDCCDNGGCWKSRCQKVNDGDEKDDNNLCLYPVKISNQNISIPKCMNMIKPKDVIRSIEMYYEGGLLEYDK